MPSAVELRKLANVLRIVGIRIKETKNTRLSFSFFNELESVSEHQGEGDRVNCEVFFQLTFFLMIFSYNFGKDN